MIVVDSSVLVAFFNSADSLHRTATTRMEEFRTGRWGRGLLLEYVFLELATILMLRLDHGAATRIMNGLLRAAELILVPCSELFPGVVRTFSEQQGTKLSFVDVAIATVAKQRADGLVLTFDR